MVNPPCQSLRHSTHCIMSACASGGHQQNIELSTNLSDHSMLNNASSAVNCETAYCQYSVLEMDLTCNLLCCSNIVPHRTFTAPRQLTQRALPPPPCPSTIRMHADLRSASSVAALVMGAVTTGTCLAPEASAAMSSVQSESGLTLNTLPCTIAASTCRWWPCTGRLVNVYV